MKRLLVLMGAVSLGCGAKNNACTEACETDGEFWDACYETLQEEHNLFADCYEDVDALAEELAAAGSDPEARSAVYAAQRENGNAYDCEDADAIVADCTDRVEAEWRLLDREERDEREAECIDPEETAFTQAMADGDCAAFVEALGG